MDQIFENEDLVLGVGFLGYKLELLKMMWETQKVLMELQIVVMLTRSVGWKKGVLVLVKIYLGTEEVWL